MSLLFAGLLLDLQRRYTAATRESARYHAGSEAVQAAYLHLKDLEAHQRGYLLTGDSTFLDDYREARVNVEAALAAIRQLVRNDDERRFTAGLDELARTRLRASAEVLRLSEEAGRGTAALLVATGEGRRAMADFEAAVSATQDAVEAAEAERTAAIGARFRGLLAFVLVGLAATGGAGVFSGLKLRRYARAQEESAGELRAANDKLLAQTEELLQQRDELESQTLELEVQTQELNEASRELAEREEWFRALVEEAAELILVLDRAGTITYASPSAARLLGGEPGALDGSPITAHIHDADGSSVQDVLRDVLTTAGTARRLEARLRVQDGGFRHVAGHARNLLELAAVEGIVINCLDVTQERSVQAQLQQSQKMDAVGQLAGGVAHDFNNLLTTIRGYAGFAADSLPEDHAVQEDLREVTKAADLAASLTRQLLAFSRQQMTQPEVLDLNDVLQDATGMLRRLLGAGITMVTRLDPGLHPVRADPGEVRQVIMNLAVNARDAMPEGGRLVIETSNTMVSREHAERRGISHGSYVLVSVTDTGAGIPLEIQNRIFDPFFTTKEQGKGTGLGLSTTWGIVQRAGGYIWVYSEQGTGTTFKVYLPAATGEEAAAMTPEQEQAGAEVGVGVTVLVVEDDDAVRRFARRALERSGFTVAEAPDGDAALEVLRSDPSIGVVVTDVIMPGMSGAVLGRHLQGDFPLVRVLYTSGYPRDEVSWRGTIPPNVAFIGKPYSADELVQHVAEVLDGSHNEGG